MSSDDESAQADYVLAKIGSSSEDDNEEEDDVQITVTTTRIWEEGHLLFALQSSVNFI